MAPARVGENGFQVFDEWGAQWMPALVEANAVPGCRNVTSKKWAIGRKLKAFTVVHTGGARYLPLRSLNNYSGL